MTDHSSSPSIAAVVVAAGKGARAGQAIPKQFANWRGKAVVRHSVEALRAAGIGRIVVAIPADAADTAQTALKGIEAVEFVNGGATRQASVAATLEQLTDSAPDIVLIHDAARPDLPAAVVDRLIASLGEYRGSIPVLPVIDSLSVEQDGIMSGAADRDALKRVQTPQAFHFSDILAAHRAMQPGTTAGDDAQVLMAAGGVVAHVAGDERLKKLTFAEDFMNELPPIRTGLGYDVHRLAKGEELWLGGIQIEHESGLAGHSDADVALHAIVDALLGAVSAGDIGEHFQPSDERWRGAASSAFVQHASSLVKEAGYQIGNVDLTIICEAPKIGPHRPAMRAKIAGLLNVDIDRISVKATTAEKLGFTGRKEGIAAQAVATVFR